MNTDRHVWMKNPKGWSLGHKKNGAGGFVMRKFVWLILFIAVGCASGGHSGSTMQDYSIDHPEGWRELDVSGVFMVTREGAFSQYILVQRRHVDKPFRHTKKRFKRNMLPQEAAGVILDEIGSDSKILNFRIMECRPAKVSRYDGFRVVFTYKEQDGLKFKTVFYGLLQGDWFYSLRYSAAEDKCSDEDMEVFERVLNSFKILGSPSA
jgi:hypothetical protein